MEKSDAGFVFSDGHGIARYTKWFASLADLDKIDWEAAYAKYWRDTSEQMDRQRRKQAEFLIHRHCDWSLIAEIGVIDNRMKARVEAILSEFRQATPMPVCVKPEWYY